jgi:multidrug efflux pump subunit AcrA (membrane-fusion protein)
MDLDIRAELELRTAEAENLIDIQVNEARHAQALHKLKRSADLQRRTFLSTEELGGFELEATTARLQIEQSKYRRKLAEIERRKAEAMVRAREYISPHDGVVVEVLKEKGEAVSVSEPIFRVVDVDALKVSGYLNLNDFWRVRTGQAVRISPEIDGDVLPIESEVFTGRIVFVDRRIDPTTRTCKVVAEVANRDLLLASGLEARMEILLDAPATAPRGRDVEPSSPTPGPHPGGQVPRDGASGPGSGARTGPYGSGPQASEEAPALRSR